MKCLGFLSLLAVSIGQAASSLALAEAERAVPAMQEEVRRASPLQADVAAFYRALSDEPFWFDPQGQPRLLRQQQLEAWILLSHEHGLNPRDYGFSGLSQPVMQQSVVEREQRLTRQFLRLAADLQGTGLVLQRDSSWHFTDSVVTPDRLAARLAGGESVRQLLDSLLPQAAEYRRLVQLYRHLWITSQQPWHAPDVPAELVFPGDQSPQMPALRRWLQAQLWLDLAQAPNVDAETYSEDMVMAIRRFQHQRGLDADGIIGPDTRRELLRGPEELLRQVRANLARWRALPSELGERYLLVRTGAFNLDLVEHDRSLQRHAVIAGRPGRPSPSFSAQVDRLIFNPNWTVPFRLAVEDLLPKQQADAQYFQRQGIEVLQRQADGQWLPVDSAGIDWSGLSRRNFHYLLRQQPGPLNSLGRIRVGMSNPYSIYLHDTPQQSLYAKAQRAFSSGCIRVQGIDELARMLAGEEGVETALSQSETRQLTLDRALPVYLVYLTVWVNEAGEAFIHPDSYGRDLELNEGLGPLPTPPPQHLTELARNVLEQ